MRIYGNREIKTLPGRTTRPTTARVREALFNIWQQKIANCHWLDLCAGTGSLGAEALCRGAARVTAIEKDPRACSIIKENWQRIIREGQSFKVLRGDVAKRLIGLKGKQFDRIYFDPPYHSNLYREVLEAIAVYNLLMETGEIALEGDRSLWTPLEVAGLEICRQKVYGNTILTFYRTTRQMLNYQSPID